MQEGFERVELKIQKVRSDIHQLDKDLDKHMEMHRELEAEIASLKKARAPRASRTTRARR
jgi:Skp family chaperone for outer membrane proteins